MVLKDLTQNYRTDLVACNWNTPNPNYQVLWSQTIQYDESSPTISITSPSNNTDFASSTSQITVSGTVSDSGSGIQSVTVNGVNATVSGSIYSAAVNINYGLNTITAVATSNVNSTTTSQPISVFRYESASSGSGTSNTITNPIQPVTTPSNTTVTPTVTTTTPTVTSTTSNNTNMQPKTTNSSAISTPVKVAGSVGVAGGAGLATASFLGYVPYKKIGLLIFKIVGK